MFNYFTSLYLTKIILFETNICKKQVVPNLKVLAEITQNQNYENNDNDRVTYTLN